MQVTKETISSVTTKFIAIISVDEIQASVDGWFVQEANSFKLDGFRKGKVPIELAKKNFMAQAKRSVVKNLINSHIEKIIDEEKLRPILRPRYTIESGEHEETLQDVKFNFLIDTTPDIETLDLKKLKLETVKCELTQEYLDKTINEMVAKHKFIDNSKDKVISGKHLVSVKLGLKVQGKYVKELSGQVLLDFRKKPEGMTPIEKMVIDSCMGKKAGDVFEKSFLIDESFMLEKYLNKKAVMEISIGAIYEEFEEKLTDETAKKLGCKDLEDYKNKVAEQIKGSHKFKLDIYHKRKILDALSDNYVFDVPSGLVYEDFINILTLANNELEENKRKGTAPEDEKISEENVKEYETLANRRVRLGFIIENIAKVKEIKVTEEQVSDAIRKEINKHPEDAKNIVKFYTKNPQAINTLITPIIEGKVLEAVLNDADISEEIISLEEFEKRMEDILPSDDD